MQPEKTSAHEISAVAQKKRITVPPFVGRCWDAALGLLTRTLPYLSHCSGVRGKRHHMPTRAIWGQESYKNSLDTRMRQPYDFGYTASPMSGPQHRGGHGFPS